MPEINPYQPPEAQPEPTTRSARSPLATLLRALAVVAGFTLLADPFPASVVDNRFRVAAKFLGAALMLAAFVPFGRAGKVTEREMPGEDL